MALQEFAAIAWSACERLFPHRHLSSPVSTQHLIRLLDLEVLCFYRWAFVRVWEYLAGIQLARLFEHFSTEPVAWPGWGWIFDACVVLVPFWSHYVLPSDLTQDRGFAWLACLLVFAAACAADSEDGMPSSGLLGRLFAIGPLVKGAEFSHAVYHMNTPIRDSMPVAFWYLQGWAWKYPAIMAAFLAAAIVVTKLEHWVARYVHHRLKGEASS